MKIVDVLNEAPPGVSATTDTMQTLKGLGTWSKQTKPGKAVSSFVAKQQNKKLAKQNQKKWYDHVKKLQIKGNDMNNPDVYKKELLKYLSSNNTIPLGNQLTQKIQQAKLTDKSVLDIITDTIAARKDAKKQKKEPQQ